VRLHSSVFGPLQLQPARAQRAGRRRRVAAEWKDVSEMSGNSEVKETRKAKWLKKKNQPCDLTVDKHQCLQLFG
jgi:hypothetical protein